MRLCIRLQQHGKKNHPYWWIVVAPQHKNIFGRNTEHIGYWSPRHNVNIKRQVILNMPKLLYWIGNGATPTPKVHKFLHMFGILPKPWYYKKSAKQLADLAAKQPSEQQMKPKKKILRERKKKREARTELNPFNYHRYQSMSMFTSPQQLIKKRLLAKQHANQFQNSVIRDALMQTDLTKYDKIAELSRNKQQNKTIDERINNIREKMRKAKSQLAYIQRQHKNLNSLQKSKIINTINSLVTKLDSLEVQRANMRLPGDIKNDKQFVDQDYLQSKLKYELVTKKFQKTQKQLSNMQKLFQPVTVGQFALKIKQFSLKNPNKRQELTDKQYYAQAEQIIAQRNMDLSPVTRIELLALDSQQYSKLLNLQDQDEKQQIQSINSLYKELLSDDVALPSINPVHPRPDLHTYIPQQHYDPIDTTRLNIMLMDSLQPHQQIQKYKKKRNFDQPAADIKKQNHKKRMERLRLLIQN